MQEEIFYTSVYVVELKQFRCSSTLYVYLTSKSLAGPVRDVGIVLPGGRSTHESVDKDPEDTDGMLRRHWEYMLDEKCVEFDHLKDEDQLKDGDESHPGATRVEPTCRRQTLWGELEKGAA